MTVQRLRCDLAFVRALAAVNLRATLALRGAFWLALVGMMLNNLLYFAMWWIFFDRFEEVRGWRFEDMCVLYGVVGSGYGLAVALTGGVRELARRIVDGDLDPYLTQPKNALIHAVGSKGFASGWGDVASGTLLIGVSGVVGPFELPLVALAIALSASVFLATGIVIQSMAFWLGRIETLARTIWEFLITFSLYPPTIFAGALRVVLFTLVPAGFIGFLPSSLVRDFSWLSLLAAAAGLLAYALLATVVFRAGLRRYESGNRFGIRA